MERVPERPQLRVVCSGQHVVPPHLHGVVAVTRLRSLPHLSGDVLLSRDRPLSGVLCALVQVPSTRPHQRRGGAPGQRYALEHGEVIHDPVGRHHHHVVLGGRMPGKAADDALAAGLDAALDDGGLHLVAERHGRVLHVVQPDDVAVPCERGQQAHASGTPCHFSQRFGLLGQSKDRFFKFAQIPDGHLAFEEGRNAILKVRIHRYALDGFGVHKRFLAGVA